MGLKMKKCLFCKCWHFGPKEMCAWCIKRMEESIERDTDAQRYEREEAN